MSVYSLDLAFDLQLQASPAVGDALLSQGFTKVGEVGNPVYTARTFNPKESLRVTLYDLTDLEPLAEVVAMGCKISFFQAYPEQHLPPVVPTGKCQSEPSNSFVFDRFKIFRGKHDQRSTVFQDERAVPIYFFECDGPKFPSNQLQSEGHDVVVSADIFTVQNCGRYYYNVELLVLVAGELEPRRFRVDPEMIISPTGPGGGGRP